MHGKQFQALAKRTWHPEQMSIPPLVYLAMGMGEVGEVVGEIKKIYRDDDGEITADRRTRLLYEIGDVLWYLALISDILGLTLDEVMKANLKKLALKYKLVLPQGILEGDEDL